MCDTKFFEPPQYNLDGRQSLWVESCIQSHDAWCGCNNPAIHLLNCLLPPGHKDRQTTVEVLIQQAYNTKWPSGGTEDAGTTIQEDNHSKEEENIREDMPEEYTGEEIEELLAAAAADRGPR